MTESPVQTIESDENAGAAGPEHGTALCLSGGGYRAMLFHVGTLWRLYEAGMLRDIKRISSVSGGSITAGLLGLKWSRLSFDPARVGQDFVAELVKPIRALASTTIDIPSILSGLILPGRVSDRIKTAYEEHLFGNATLQDLPDEPRFVINATNVQSGALWRFMKPYMRDYRVGEVKKPTIPLSLAVTASSAFPPVLSPVEMKLDPASFTQDSGTDLHRPPFTTNVILSDGGVYDNMGLETAWKRYDTILVSDAGGKMQAEAAPKNDWAQHAYRVLDLVDNQVRSLRKRQVIDSFKSGDVKSGGRKGAYWGIRTDIKDYKVASALDCPHDRTLALAATDTRLARLDDVVQERLINWGYAACDAALRKHVVPGLPAPGDFPYPTAKV
jgi:NTE family protein